MGGEQKSATDALREEVERQKKALYQLDQIHYRQFDPQKLDKVLKILKLGI